MDKRENGSFKLIAVFLVSVEFNIFEIVLYDDDGNVSVNI